MRYTFTSTSAIVAEDLFTPTQLQELRRSTTQQSHSVSIAIVPESWSVYRDNARIMEASEFKYPTRDCLLPTTSYRR